MRWKMAVYWIEWILFKRDRDSKFFFLFLLPCFLINWFNCSPNYVVVPSLFSWNVVCSRKRWPCSDVFIEALIGLHRQKLLPWVNCYVRFPWKWNLFHKFFSIPPTLPKHRLRTTVLAVEDNFNQVRLMKWLTGFVSCHFSWQNSSPFYLHCKWF